MKLNKNFVRLKEIKKGGKWFTYKKDYVDSAPFSFDKMAYDRPISKKDGYKYRVESKVNKRGLSRSFLKLYCYDIKKPNERWVITRDDK